MLSLKSLKLDPVAIASLVVLFIFLYLAATQIQPALDNPRVISTEAPLEKNTPLQIKSNETYIYSYSTNNRSVNITYTIEAIPGCTLISIVEAEGSPALCLDTWGVGKGGSNASFDQPSILLFKPWMLALKDGWTWNTSIYIVFEGGASEHVSDVYYRVVRREIFEGHDTFVVEIRPSAGDQEYDYVDAEKRILLKAEGVGYDVALINQTAIGTIGD
jgi:hypothetical protein